MNQSLRALFAVFTLMFFAGCGQSGPLYVPGDPSTVEPQSQPRQQQTTEDEDEDDNNGAESP